MRPVPSGDSTVAPRRRGRPPSTEPTRTEQKLLLLTPDERVRWQRCADDAGVSLAEWIRGACEIRATRRA